MTTPRPLRIAIAQMRMQWTIEANMASVVEAMELSQRRGAQLCTFPELAVTGFHREIVSQGKPALVQPQVQALQALCRQLSMAVAIGAPTFGANEGERYNSHLLIREDGGIAATVNKIGITPAEATFFQPGADRPIAVLQGLRCSAVICREIEDLAQVREQLPEGSVDLVFWPGQMRPDPDKPVIDPPAHVVDAQRLAVTLRAFVVQANWPNALNRPLESKDAGHSAVIAPDGDLLFRLPKEAPGLAVFTLGEREFEWHPGPARVATPAAAEQAGATHVVIGRAIARAGEPRAAFELASAAFDPRGRIRITPATVQDCDELGALHVASWQAAYPHLLPAAYLAQLSVERRAASWRQVLAEGKSTLLVARKGDALLGFVSFGPSRDTDAPPHRGEVWALYVAPAAWGQGIGRRLWQAACNRLRALQHDSVSLWVLAGNERAIRFYTSLGFEAEAGEGKEFDMGGVRLREVRMLADLRA